MVAIIGVGAEKDEMGAVDELMPNREGGEGENAADEGPDDGRKGAMTIGVYELRGDSGDGGEGGSAVNDGAGLVELGRGTWDGGAIDERLKTSHIKVGGAARRVGMGEGLKGLLTRSLKCDATGGATESSSSMVMTVEP